MEEIFSGEVKFPMEREVDFQAITEKPIRNQINKKKLNRE